MDTLPNELLLHIADFLSSPKDIAAFQACSSWTNSVLNDQSLWKALFQRSFAWIPPHTQEQSWKSIYQRYHMSARSWRTAQPTCFGSAVGANELWGISVIPQECSLCAESVVLAASHLQCLSLSQPPYGSFKKINDESKAVSIATNPSPEDGEDVYINKHILVVVGCHQRVVVFDRDHVNRQTVTLGAHPYGIATRDTIFAGAGSDKLAVWDLETGATLMHIQSHASDFITLNLTQRYIVATDTSGRICIRSRRDKTDIATFKGHQSEIWAAAIDPNTECIVTGGYDRNIHLWDLRKLQSSRTTENSTAVWTVTANSVRSLAYDGLKRRLVVGGKRGEVMLWAVEGTQTPIAQTTVENAFLRSTKMTLFEGSFVDAKCLTSNYAKQGWVEGIVVAADQGTVSFIKLS